MRVGDKQYSDYSLNSLKLINVGPKLHFELDTDGTLMDSLVAFWKLDEPGNGRHDVLGKNHLTDNNRVSAAQGRSTINGVRGNAGHFTRSRSQYFSIADNADLSTGDIDFSITAWVYMDTKVTNQGTIVGKDPTNHEYKIWYKASPTDRFVFSVMKDGVTFSSELAADNLGSPSTGTWYFIVAWHDAVNNEIGIQVNNGTANTTAYSGGAGDTTGAFAIGARSDGAADTHFDGRIDDVGFWKKVLSSQERTDLYNSGNGNTVTGGDWPLYQFSTDSSGELLRDLVAYWKLDENIPASAAATTRYDSVGLNHLTDNATVTEAGGIRGQAGQFTAANSEYLSIADNSDLQTGNINFTWAAWVYNDANDANTRRIVAKDDPNGGYQLSINANNDPNPNRFAFYIGAGGGIIATTFGAAPTGQWIFVVGWFDTSADTINIQINNGTVDSATNTSAGMSTSGNPFNMGRYSAGGGFWNGRIDEIGIWKRVLTAAEKTDLYNSGAGQTITDQNKTNNKRFRIDTNGTLMTDLKAYWKLDENAGTRYDEIGENNLTDIATVTQTYGIKSFAGQFTAANSEYLTIKDSPDLKVGNSDATMALWFYADSLPATFGICVKYGGTTNSEREFMLMYQTNRFLLQAYQGNTEFAVVANTFGIASTGTWYFIVWYHNASADEIGISINNGAFDTLAMSASGFNTTTKPFLLGAFNSSDTPGSFANGRIDEVGFWKKVLSSQERSDLYNSGIGNTVIKDEIL